MHHNDHKALCTLFGLQLVLTICIETDVVFDAAELDLAIRVERL